MNKPYPKDLLFSGTPFSQYIPCHLKVAGDIFRANFQFPTGRKQSNPFLENNQRDKEVFL